ncbi:MAG: nucleotide-binding protein, partial [bacterium]|nr:nucleotide-binding protein [bacterium]
SSAEGLDVAREVELHLEHEALTTIWKDGVFGLGSGTLESPMVALDGFDFAVMVLSPDDLLETRKTRYSSPRDNVIFVAQAPKSIA